MAMAADGRTLAGALDDGRIALWNTADPDRTGRSLSAQYPVYSLALSGDGTILATSGGGVGWLWPTAASGRPRALTGHEGGISEVAMSADGTTVIAAVNIQIPGPAPGEDRDRFSLWAWTATAPAVPRRLTEQPGTVDQIKVSADGKAVTGIIRHSSKNNEVWVWRTGDPGTKLRLSGGHRISSLRDDLFISANGATVAVRADNQPGSRGDAVVVWTVDEPGKPRRMAGDVDLRSAISISTDSKILTRTPDGTGLLLQGITKADTPLRLTGQQGIIDQIALSDDGSTAAATTNDRGSGSQVWLWDTAAPSRPQRLSGYVGGTIEQILLSGAGRGIDVLTAAEESGQTKYDQQLWHWDTAAPDRPRELTGHQGRLSRIEVSANATVVVGSGDYATWLWRTSTDERARLLDGYHGPVHGVALTSDGRIAAGRGKDGTVWRWDLTRPAEPSRPFIGQRLAITEIALSANGHLLAGTDARGTVWIWDAASPLFPGRALRGTHAQIIGLAVSANGRTLVGFDGQGTIWAWDTSRPDQAARILHRLHEKIKDVTLGANGRVLAAATYSAGVLVWDPLDGETARSFTGLKGEIDQVALSANGELLAGGGSGGEVWTWDIQGSDQQLGHLLAGHRSAIANVTVSTDETTIVSADSDGHIRMWTVAAQGQIGPVLSGYLTSEQGIALDDNASTLLATDSDGNLHLWQMATRHSMPACVTLAERMRRTPEWKQHLGETSVQEACHP
ncbi:WD-40 repeat protein [[Actinomadura] parvosata subsp. kistnae]|uniref:Anaphase-promoting complex subunit 4 WD40 domain-containing protein n=1 Tax=[Actinomadura] parvosata subsp. kistnae TaxID=1909395 RepID=A0A1U9ZYE6_9ACTN|nr:hypothetical protein [Nonomuraea sp. ATCC 55076]AQZ62939.1 hypothetical protein BKM31_17035 [Nonomuraea sp. ATCC 55076]SPL95834.1 WD-40 repeat protein [Actinomadura parvosata subsp. kistnae]